MTGWATCSHLLDREYHSGSETSLSACLRTASCSRLWNAWMKNRMYVTRSCVCQARSLLCSFTTRLKKAGNLSMCAEKPAQAGTFSLNFSLTMVCSKQVPLSSSLCKSLEIEAHVMLGLHGVRQNLDRQLSHKARSERAHQDGEDVCITGGPCVKVRPQIVFQVLRDLQQHDALELGWYFAVTSQFALIDLLHQGCIEGRQSAATLCCS